VSSKNFLFLCFSNFFVNKDAAVSILPAGSSGTEDWTKTEKLLNETTALAEKTGKIKADDRK
jgi:hypothetical protein